MGRILPHGYVLSGSYRIVRKLGEGGMAVVYLADDLKHPRQVAVKLIRPGSVDPRDLVRFRREIESAARLSHPHIVKLYDSGDLDGAPYFVMDYIAGESLRDRLRRERQLGVDDALQITSVLASALASAHSKGIVHRDVKPENVLMGAGEVYLTDFGLAMSVDPETRVTETGIVVGTPLYMSPEQIGGDAEVDGRSDIYSLGWMLFEMLAGRHPLAGGGARLTAARHLLVEIPSIRHLRADVPGRIDRAIQKAMAKNPADRFASVEEFAGALTGARPRLHGRLRGIGLPWNRAPSWGTAAKVGIALTLVVISTALPRNAWIGLLDPGLNPMRFAVLPAPAEADVSAPLRFDLLLEEALARWQGIEVVDRLQIADASAREGPGPMDPTRLARSVGAGRMVQTGVTRVGDSIEVHAALYTVGRRSRLIRTSTATIAAAQSPPDSIAVRMAQDLLSGALGDGGVVGALVTTRSVGALGDYLRGQAALQNWEMVAADSLFHASSASDPGFALANLWTAQVGDWRRQPAASWRLHAERARRDRADLPQREAFLADALTAMAEDRFPDACAAYEEVRRRDDRDFAAWFGLGRCRSADPVVLTDQDSPSGWRYRSSYRLALESYIRAFQAAPSGLRAFRGDAFADLRDLFITRADRSLAGRAQTDGVRRIFWGWPVAVGDSIAIVPYPIGQEPPREAHNAALIEQRNAFHEAALSWTREYPQSADARFALALSLEMLGDPRGALATLQEARALQTESSDGLAMVAAEIWLRCKLAIPDDVDELRRVRVLADSVLASASGIRRGDAEILIELAGLTGRPTEAARRARAAAKGSTGMIDIPLPVARTASAIVAFAAVGADPDSLSRLEDELEVALRSSIAAPALSGARANLLRNAVLLSPGYTFRYVEYGEIQSPQAAAQQALARGYKPEVLRIFDGIRTGRTGRLPEDVTIDAVYSEAELLRTLGDPKRAIAWLDPALGALRAVQPGGLSGTGRSASLVRAMALRAELADQVGDIAGARRWARPVTILWGDGDPSVDRRIATIRRLAEGDRKRASDRRPSR